MHLLSRTSIVAALASASAAAAAHTGHGTDGLLAGLAHPLAADHLLAVIAVGLWAARGSTLPQRLARPLVFLLALLLGALTGWLGLFQAPAATALAASVVAFGMVLALPTALPPTVALAAIAAAALLHGLAHGCEAPAATPFATYAVGFMATTLALQALGLAAGRRLARLHAGLQVRLWRGLGVAMGLAGAALLTA